MRGLRLPRAGGVVRAALVGLGVAGLLAILPAAASATITGGCSATGTSTSGGTIDLTNTAVWHVHSTDRISVRGTAPTPQTDASVGLYAFGIAIPLAGGHADGETTGASDEFDVSILAKIGRVFELSGSSSGPAGGCSADVELVIDDVNPLLTVLGGGGAIAVLLGVVAVTWALRKPAGLLRRYVGLVALFLIGAGGSELLQQAAAGNTSAQTLAHSAFVDSVAGPTQVSVDPVTLGLTGVLTILIVLLMPFPGELFNRTLEENYDRIRASMRRIPFASRFIPSTPASDPRMRGGRRRLVVLIVALASALLYALLDPDFGPDGRSLVTYLGILLALLLVAWFAALPQRWIHLSLTGEKGRLWAVPGTLLVAAVCVLISRVVGFLPGYLYGLILGYAFIARLEGRQEARAAAAGAWWMVSLAFIGWLTLGAVRTPGIADTVPAQIAAAVLASLVVAGLEGIAIGLVPLRFLPGEPIYGWRRWHWAVLYAIGVFGFIFIVLNPVNGFLAPARQVSFVTSAALFFGFGVVSVLFWAWFRFRPGPAPGDSIPE